MRSLDEVSIAVGEALTLTYKKKLSTIKKNDGPVLGIHCWESLGPTGVNQT